MGFLFLNAFVLDYSENSKAQRLCRNYSRLVASTFLVNAFVCINKMRCCFIFGKNNSFPERRKSFEGLNKTECVLHL